MLITFILDMFVQSKEKAWIEAKIDEVVYLSGSVNRPVVVLPDYSPEPAQAYVCIVRRDKGYEVYVYLHLIHSNVPILYVWDAGAVPKELVPDVRRSALEFTESMGFMMSDYRWRELKPQEKQEVYNSVPIFFQDISSFKEEVEEEMLEIEPAEEEELVVEPVEEEPETITEGDFVLKEEVFEQEEDKGLEVAELPDIKAEQAKEMSEEDILLEQLEIKEEAGAVEPEQAEPAQQAPSASKVPQITVEVEEEASEQAEQTVSQAEVQIEVEEEPTEEQPSAQQKEEEIFIEIEEEPKAPEVKVEEAQPIKEAPQESEPEKTLEQVIDEQIEEVMVEEVSEPAEQKIEPAFEQVAEKEAVQAEEAKSEQRKPEAEFIEASSVLEAEPASPQSLQPEEKASKEAVELSEEDKELIARLLAMF